jgi:phage gp36-like protein
MTFLQSGDLDMQIQAVIRNTVTGNSDTILDAAERAAIAEATSYLKGRYDTAVIFAATGSARNPILMTYLIDMMLYHIHCRITPSNIPAVREKRYENAIKWLEMVAADKLNPDLPVLPAQVSGNFSLGSNLKASKSW